MSPKLDLLTTKFENLWMSEEETNSDFNGKLCNIANESFSLREKIQEEKLLKKDLRSLPPRFAYDNNNKGRKRLEKDKT